VLDGVSDGVSVLVAEVVCVDVSETETLSVVVA